MEMPDTAVHSQAFQADVARLLHLMVHSVYSDRDIFLARAACPMPPMPAKNCAMKRSPIRRWPRPLSQSGSLLDKEAQTLTIEDNGIGMSHQDLTDHLGTIARSGTRAFLDRLNLGGEAAVRPRSGAKTPEKLDLIGQFGIGFYSAFMVADRVDVFTGGRARTRRCIGARTARGRFSIEPLAQEEAPVRGTRVVLAPQRSLQGLSRNRAGSSAIVREHSSALAVPIELVEEKGRRAAPIYRWRGALDQAEGCDH